MISKKDAEVALEKCNGMKVTAGMANNIVSDKQKRKKQKREEKKLAQTVKTEEGEAAEAVEAAESGSKERVIAVDWALSKEKWEEEKAKLGDGEGPDEDVEMGEGSEDGNSDEDARDGSNADDSEEDEQLGLHEDDASDDEDGSSAEDDDEAYERDSDDDAPVKPQLPQTDTGTTIFIRNIPFAATEDELRTL